MSNKSGTTNDPVKLKDLVVSEQGSLGLLALGALGLKMWRQQKLMAKKESDSENKQEKHVKKK